MIFALIASAPAESWCATPLVAHEWGVTVVLPQGGQIEGPGVPGWMHRTGTMASDTPTRSLPPDSGERELPVLTFFSGPHWNDNVPVGLEVGFTGGEATVWYPAVDERTPARFANSPAGANVRNAMLSARSRRKFGDTGDLGRDVSKQLHWDALVLTQEPLSTLNAPLPWVQRAREVKHALWVNRPSESERFVFYEAQTQEVSAIAVSATPRGFRFENVSAQDVHDLVWLHEGEAWTAPRVPTGKSVEVSKPTGDLRGLRAHLDANWTITRSEALESDWSKDCVMGRDPAIPTEVASDHRLFSDELEVLWSAWESRIFEHAGDRLVYREDPATLDAVMPLSIYTDMYHDPHLSRLGLVVVESPQVSR